MLGLYPGRWAPGASRIPIDWKSGWSRGHDPAPRSASRSTRAPGAPATANRANTRARSPAPSWTSCGRCYGSSTTPRRDAASRHTSRSPTRPAACRATAKLAEALKALEWAGVLTWQNRLVRIRERCRDLFGHAGWRWRTIRTSNAYTFLDPIMAAGGRFSSESDYPPGTTLAKALHSSLSHLRQRHGR
jgi:hypothetical protein